VPFAEVNDGTLFYTDEGNGVPAVLPIHGWACDSHDWSWQLDAFATHHRVIAADNRGHGRSAPTGDYSSRSFASDLACLVETLGAGPVVAVGHSIGGAIASALAVEYPSLVRALVVVDPGYGVFGARAAFIAKVLEGLRGSSPVQALEDTFNALEGPGTPAALRTWHRRRALGTAWDVVVETLARNYEGDEQFGQRAEAEAYLRGRRCPVLAIYSDPDRAAWEATTHLHSYSRHVAWEGTGHWPHQERADEFNTLVLEWVAQLPEG